MQRLRVMADYFCFPLWISPYNVDPASLPLSPALVGALMAWAARWDAILVMDDPASSDFASPEQEDRFNADGHALATRVAEELGDAFEVAFFSTYGRTTIIDRQRSARAATPDFPTLVGPVRSVHEVQGLRRMGAAGVSFLFAPHPIFADNRIISPEHAQRVCEQLPGRHGLILSPSMTIEMLPQLLSSIEVSFVELDVRVPPAPELLQLARSRGLELLATGVAAEHDHEDEAPLTWLLERAATRFEPDLFVVTLVPSWRDPYRWFTEEAGEWWDDLTQAHVSAALQTHPVLVNMSLGDRSPLVLRELFPAARGAYVYVGRPSEERGTPSLTPPP